TTRRPFRVQFLPWPLGGTAQGNPLTPLLFSLAIEPLAIHHKILLYADDPAYIKPFRWAPKGFKYLGIQFTPTISQLYTENIKPLLNHIKEKMTSWKKLPISLLGRINLVKMIVLPKIMYPLLMLFVLLDVKDIKYINKAMSDFIWAGRKPKLKLDILQLPKEMGGWGLPKIEYYVLSVHARVISLWANQNKLDPWLEIENTLCRPSCTSRHSIPVQNFAF
uniref:Reverse transcriptase domain-containing protein n=1 Tax=Oryzias melastigma TaxID=30732 RepID=A0A3B3BC45_ORYME